MLGALASSAVAASRPPLTLRNALLGLYVLGLGVSISLSQGALVALSALWLWRLRDPTARRRVCLPLLAPVLAFSGATILSALASGHPGPSLLAAKGLLLVMALYVTVDALTDGVDADLLVSALVAVCAVAALAGLVQVLTCWSPPITPGLPTRFYRCDRARGFFSIYMTLAGVLTLVLLASVPRLLPGPGRWGLLAAPWLVMVAGLAATYVRGAWLGFGAGMAAVIALARRGRALVALALVGLVGLALVGPGQLQQRLRSMTDPQEATIKERVYMWRSGGAMLQERPLLGVGPGGVKREYPRFAVPEAVKQKTGHLHNTPLQILVERGLVGLAAWLWIWVAFYARAGTLLFRLGPERRDRRALLVGSLAAITGFLVSGLSEYNFGDSEVVLVAWTLMAVPFAVTRAGTTRAADPARLQDHPSDQDVGAGSVEDRTLT